MSGYDYANRSGYADHIGQPVSYVSYDGGRGTRTYVTKIEERVERVRRPSVMGYSYSSAVKEKEGRPKEVDDFITKILDEVNGPSVSTTRRVDAPSDYGVDYKFGVDSPTKVDGRRGYYEVEYIYVGSPGESRISRKYGNPSDHQGLSSYDHPSQRDYGVPNKTSDNFRQMSEILRDYEVPMNQWVRSSRPNYDATSNNPPYVESHASKGREVKPESPRDDRIPNNRWDKESVPVFNRPLQRDYGVPNQPSDNSRVTQTPRDYEAPKNRWERSSRPTYEGAPYNPPSVESLSLKSYEVNPESPRDGVPNNQWGKQSSPVYDHPTRRDYGVPDNRWTNSSVKPQSPKDYEGSGNQWSRSSNPNYDQPKPNSQWGNSPVKPQTSNGYGDPDNQWSSPSRQLKPAYDQLPNGKYVDTQQDNSLVKPVSGKGFGILDNQKGRSLVPQYDQLPRNDNIGGAPNNRWGNSPVKLTYDQTPPNEDNIGAMDRQQGNSSLKPQSPKGYGVSDNQGGRSSSPNYETSPQSKVLGGGPKNWGNSPLKPTFDQASPNGLQRYPSMKQQSPNGYVSPENHMDGSQTRDYENPSQNGMSNGIPKTRLGNSPPRTQSPRDNGARDNKWGKPSSPVYNNNPPQNANQEQKHGFPSDPKGRSTSPGYEHPPRYEIVPPPALKVRIPAQDSGIVDGVDNKQGNNIPVKAQRPVYNHSLPNAYGEQKLEQPNVAARSVMPGVGNKPNVTSNAYGLEPKGNNYFQPNKPVGNSYD